MKKFWILALFGVAVMVIPVMADEIKKSPWDLLSKSDVNKLTKSLKTYFNEKDSYKKEKYLDKLKGDMAKLEKSKKIDSFVAHPDFFTKLINSTLEYKRSGFLKGKLNEVKNEMTARGTTYKNLYHIWLPRKYDARESWPVVVGLHPPGTTGKEYFEKTYKGSELADTCIFLCPTMQGETADWTSNEGRFQILALTLARVWEEYNLDRTRIFLDGSGEGAQQSLTLASWYADLFAGVVARACQPPERLFYTNFKHLPVMLLVGGSDSDNLAAMETMQAEFAKSGHPNSKLVKVDGAKDPFLSGVTELNQWVTDQRLVEYPEEIFWSSVDRGYGRAYWLQITRQELGKDLVSSFHAKINRETNTIEIQANENTLKLTVYLNDHLVNLGDAITVSTNGTDWKGTKERSLDKLLKSYWNRRDATRLISNDIDIDAAK